MSWKALLTIGSVLLVLGFAVFMVSGQEGDQGAFPEVPIITTASDVVGIGAYVAGEAYAVPAGEDPTAQPVQAMIFRYAIYPEMHVTVIDEFEQPEPAVPGFTFAWELEAPNGSQASLITGTVAIFQADVEGEYYLTLTATDENGNSGETTWTVFATSYVGVGEMGGLVTTDDQCAACHEDTTADWAATKHATTFTRAIDGLLSDHYNTSCVSCHTTGFNNRPEAENGGFDDLARAAGWTLPETLQPGNWHAMVSEFPEVAGMANVQCESCHGPGYLHVFEGSRRNPMISTGLDYGTCAQCHAQEPYLTVPMQWEMSAHANKSAAAFWYPIGENRASCVRCHSGLGFIDWAAGLVTEEQRTDYQIITCAVCHDPHDASNPDQLRIFDTVMLPNGMDVTDAGASATCMSCHNARVNAVALVEGERFGTPHYSTAAELMNATGGYQWGEELPTSPHGWVIENSCIGCHMADTPGADQPGHNMIGGHTFAMTSSDGLQNVTTCKSCHDGATSFEFEAFRDYDGNGVIETNQTEIAGLRTMIRAELEAMGVEFVPNHPYIRLPEGSTVDMRGAAFNYKFTSDGASADHNLRYTVSLLQLSYEKLMGEPVPNAYVIAR